MYKDITNELLQNCSPYIDTIIYNIDKRILIIECVDSPLNENMKPIKRLEFSGIIKYQEENLEDNIDDKCMNTIFGIGWLDNLNLCIHTDKKEIILTMVNHPVAINL